MKRSRSPNSPWPCRAFLAALLALWSCGGAKKASAPEASFDIVKPYERGPVAVVLKVSRKEITIAERVTLALEATASEDYEVELPKLGEKLAQFGIVDYQTDPPRLVEGGRVRTAKSYLLEPFLSGDYRVPPLKIAFWKKGEAEPTKHEIETEEVAVAVKSLLPEKQAELTLKEIAGPVELARPRRGWLAWAVGGSVAAAGLVAWATWLRRRRRKATEVPRIAAHELAYRRLETLLGEQLIEAGEVKRFIIGLSDIVRHYIEDRFGLHAPERTTEEFLDELRASEALEARFRPLLERFLGQCDLVKFAEHRPSNAEIQETFDACKEFIEATRAEEKTVELASAAA